MRPYNYERDSLPVHIRTVRALRAEIATMEAETGSTSDPVPYWWVDLLNRRRSELAATLKYRGVREAAAHG